MSDLTKEQENTLAEIKDEQARAAVQARMEAENKAKK